MKFALCSGSFGEDVVAGRTDIFDIMDIAREFGFQAVEIREDLLTDRQKDLKALQKISEAKQIKLIYSQRLWLVDSSIEKMLREVQLVKEGINTSRALGIDILKCGFGPIDKFEQLTSQHMDVLADISDFAALQGVVVCLENSDKKSGSCPHLLAEILQRLDKSNLKVTYDSGNFAFSGYDPLDALKVLEGHIGYVHLKDYKKGEPSTTWLGNGEVDFHSIFKRLEKIKYAGYFCFEFPMSIERIYEIRKSLDYMEVIKML